MIFWNLKCSKGKGDVIPIWYRTWTAYEGAGLKFHSFLTSARNSCAVGYVPESLFTPGERVPGTD